MIRQQAFSLLELIVTLTIMTLIVTVLLDLLSQSRYQMDYINKDL